MDMYTSTTDWNLALAKALSEGDGNTIMELEDINNGWAQLADERDARQALITAALDVIGW